MMNKKEIRKEMTKELFSKILNTTDKWVTENQNDDRLEGLLGSIVIEATGLILAFDLLQLIKSGKTKDELEDWFEGYYSRALKHVFEEN